MVHSPTKLIKPELRGPTPSTSMATKGKRITVKVLVDKEKQRVVLAESDKDFIDILFSFLTLPLGTIVRLLGKPSSVLGCLANLYESVEKLDTLHFNTNACKTMLLWPRSEAAARCEDLKINIDDTETTKRYYRCDSCDNNSTRYYSSVPGTSCSHCSQLISNASTWNIGSVVGGADSVFMNGGFSFMITDDLHVTEASMMHSFSLLDKLGIKDRSSLEERTLVLGQQEIMNLLKRSLVSTMPLSDLCFCRMGLPDSTINLPMKETVNLTSETETEDTKSKKIRTNLLLDEANNRVVYVEAGEELMDLLFSFLTFPLGSVIRLLKENSLLGCVDNLYKSAQDLSILYFKSEECKSLLLSPKLAPFFGCSNQLLKFEEAPSYGGFYCSACTCLWRKDSGYSSVRCQHSSCNHRSLREVNPKVCTGVTQTGGGFAKKLGVFGVTDSLGVTPLTPISAIQAASNSKVPSDKLVQREANIGEIQALNLLRAALTSQSALTNVFCLSERKRRRWKRVTSDL